MVDTDRLSHWLLCCAPYGCRMPTVHSLGKSSRTYTVDALCSILVAVNFSGWLTPALMHVFPTLCQPAWPSVELVVANKYGFSVTTEHWEWTPRTYFSALVMSTGISTGTILREPLPCWYARRYLPSSAFCKGSFLIPCQVCNLSTTLILTQILFKSYWRTTLF